MLPSAWRRERAAATTRRRASRPARPALEDLERRGLMAAGPLGINASLDFVDAMKTAEAWTGLGPGAFTRDANGWPTTDAQVTVVDDRVNQPWNGPDPNAVAPDISGTYHLSFRGSATVAPPSWDPAFTVQNQSYNAATNTTTADLSVAPGNEFLLINFTNTANPASATGAGISNAVLIKPGYAANTTQVFTNDELNALKPFGTLRFMDAADTNSYPQSFWTTGWGWSQRTLPSQASQTEGYGGLLGVAWEYMIELADQTNSDMWINIPGPATDDYVTQLANLIKNGDTVAGVTYPGLAPNLKVYLEYSNEVWGGIPNNEYGNEAASQAEVAAGGSTLNNDGSTNVYQWSERRYLERTMQVANIFRSVMGADPSYSRVRPVLGWQENALGYYSYSAFPWFQATYGSPSTYFYGMGNAIYFDATNYSSVDNAINSLQAGEAAFVGQVQAYTTIATYYGMKNVSYEGGPSLAGSGAAGQVALAASRDPRMEGIVATYLEEYYAAGGDVANFYDGPYGFWSPQAEWPVAEAYQSANPSLAAKYRGLVDVAAAAPASAPAGYPVSASAPTTFSGAVDSLGWVASTSLPGYQFYYLLNVASAGSYRLSLATLPGVSGSGQVQVYVNDQPAGGPVAITNGATVNLGALSLPAGPVTISLLQVQATPNFQWSPSLYTLAPATPVGSAAAPFQVLDDNQAGFTKVGADWSASYAAGYANESLHGSASDSASWTFAVTPGTYRVMATWAAASGNQMAASYAVGSGGAILGGSTVDQRQAPNGFIDAAGTPWQDLGSPSFTVAGTTLTVTVTGAAAGTLDADAIRVQPAAAPASAPSGTAIINDGAPGFYTSGPDWGVYYAQGYGAQVEDGHLLTDSASWTFTLAPGTYDVSATWSAYSNRQPLATYAVTSGAANLASFLVDQRQAPATSADASGAAWRDFGVPLTITGSTLTVTLTGAGLGDLIANAIRVTPATPPSNAATQVVNDGGAGFGAVGPDWATFTGQGYGNQIQEGRLAGDTASWTFAVAPGTYEVSATWTTYYNRQQAARYTLASAGASLGGATFDQRVAPSTFVDSGGIAWQDISTAVVVAGPSLTVTLSAQGSGYLNANAVRIQKLSVATTGPQIINDGGAGFAAVGPDWMTFTGQGYGNQIQEGHLTSDTASWTFAVTPGTYEVSATWTTFYNRQQSARYGVTSGGNTLGGATVDQRVTPSTFVDAGGTAWQDVARSVVVAGSSLTVTLSAQGMGFLNANAVRVQQVSTSTVVPQIINDGGSGFAAVGPDWTTFTGQGYGNQIQEGRLATDTASWTFTVAPGTYEVSATWTAYSNRQQAARYTVASGGTTLGGATVDQRVTPSTFVDSGTAWQDVGGPYTVTGTTLTVTLSAQGAGFLNANAVRILKLS